MTAISYINGESVNGKIVKNNFPIHTFTSIVLYY